MKLAIDEIKFDERELVPCIVQDAATGEVLTLAYMNAESLRHTLAERETWFWSRSRGELWHKGATSGHTQRVVAVRVDCDADAIVVLVEPRGPACHTGARTCFHQNLEGAPLEIDEDETQANAEGRALGAQLQRLHALIESRERERPAGSYTTYLFDAGLDKILKKVGEESAETLIAAKNADTAALIAESSDLIYHLLVLLVEQGVGLQQIAGELTQREEKRKQVEANE